MPELNQKKENEKLPKDIFGIRRERVYFWNSVNHKWDELKEKIWLKDKKGKEIPYKQKMKGKEL